MDKDTIINSLTEWESVRSDDAKLIDYLAQGNCFNFTDKKYHEKSTYWHAYPGIYNGELKAFVIPSAYDKKGTHDIASYVEVCSMFHAPSSGIIPQINDRIPAETAIRRVDRWEKDYSVWIPKKVSTTEGVFKAFAIPSQDFVTPQVKVRFALRTDVGQPMDYQADMIVACNEDKTIYEDFAEPVPPYKPGISQDSFYLLSLA